MSQQQTISTSTHHHHETQAGKAAKGKEKQTTTKKKKRRSLRDINSLYRIPREEAHLLEERLEEWKNGEAERTGMSGWNVLTQQMVGWCGMGWYGLGLDVCWPLTLTRRNTRATIRRQIGQLAGVVPTTLQELQVIEGFGA